MTTTDATGTCYLHITCDTMLNSHSGYCTGPGDRKSVEQPRYTKRIDIHNAADVEYLIEHVKDDGEILPHDLWHLVPSYPPCCGEEIRRIIDARLVITLSKEGFIDALKKSVVKSHSRSEIAPKAPTPPPVKYVKPVRTAASTEPSSVARQLNASNKPCHHFYSVRGCSREDCMYSHTLDIKKCTGCRTRPCFYDHRVKTA